MKKAAKGYTTCHNMAQWLAQAFWLLYCSVCNYMSYDWSKFASHKGCWHVLQALHITQPFTTTNKVTEMVFWAMVLFTSTALQKQFKPLLHIHVPYVFIHIHMKPCQPGPLWKLQSHPPYARFAECGEANVWWPQQHWKHVFCRFSLGEKQAHSFTYVEHPWCVAMISIQVYRDINVQDIPIFKFTWIRYPMADALIHWCAYTFGKPLVIKRRWVCTMINYEVVHSLVNSVCHDTSMSNAASIFKHLSSKLPSSPHFLNTLNKQISNVYC